MEDLVHAAFEESLEGFGDDVEIIYIYMEVELEVDYFQLVEPADFQV